MATDKARVTVTGRLGDDAFKMLTGSTMEWNPPACPTVGIGLLRDEIQRSEKYLDDDDHQLTRLRAQVATIETRRRETEERIVVLRKELELLEGYARLREAGEAE